MPSSALGGVRRFPTILALLLAAGFVAWLGSAADEGRQARRCRAHPVGPDALDDLPRRRLSRPAAALQGRSRVSESEVRASLAHRPLSRERPALRRRAGGRPVFVRRQAGRQGRPLLRPAQGDQDDSPARRGRRRSRRSTGWPSTRTSSRTASASSATPCGARTPASRISPDGTRVSRFTVTRTDPPRIDPSSEEIVLTFLQGGHNGGDLHFGPDGMLYISTGDAANPNPPDPFNTGQDISDLLSSILRIDVDRKDEGKNYAVPKDNPFVGDEGSPAGGLGVRLPQSLADELRSPDRRAVRRRRRLGAVGDRSIASRRAATTAGRRWRGRSRSSRSKVGPTPIRPALIELPHTIACSVTGGLRLPRQEVPRAARGLRLRRLGNATPVGRPLRGRPHQGDAGDRAAVGAHRRLRRGPGRRALLPRPRRRHAAHHRAERRRRPERRLPDEAVADRPVRLGQGPHAGGRRGPVRGEQPAVAGRRDGGALGRLPGRVVRHPLRRPASRSPAWCTGTTSACTSPRMRCW